MFQQLALIGCGLMGGSFALACAKQILCSTSPVSVPLKKTRQRALDLKVIDQTFNSVADAVQGADLVLLAVPVGAMQSSFAAMRDTLAPQALLMDVGSTKCDVIAAAQATLGERLSCFVPAHPIAGKEVAGIEHAEASLYQARRTILTPLPQNSIRQIKTASEVWTAIGSHVSHMTAQAHDATFAAVSHLPHLLAFAAVNALSPSRKARRFWRWLARAFGISHALPPAIPVWRDILSANVPKCWRNGALSRGPRPV
jgi:prephenate dehydrogenase